MNTIIETVQNWIDPLPAPKTATDLARIFHTE
jgi:hypothetical protein